MILLDIASLICYIFCMINIAIVEDSPKDAEMLTDYVRRAFTAVGESYEITVYSSAESFLTGYRGSFGIVFMDIELPDMNGMDAAKRLRKLDAGVVLIFVTNMAHFAVGGYAVDAMDFMVKPVSYENVCLKIARAVNRLGRRKEDKLVLQGKSVATVVMIPEIRYIEVLNHKLTFYTTQGEVTAAGSLSKIEEKLASFPFSRCNNCYLVNLNYVTKVEDFTVWLDKDKLAMSRARKKPFLEDIADFLGGSV